MSVTSRQYTVSYNLYGNSQHLENALTTVAGLAENLKNQINDISNSFGYKMRKNDAFANLLNKYRQLEQAQKNIKPPVLDTEAWTNGLESLVKITQTKVAEINTIIDGLGASAKTLGELSSIIGGKYSGNGIVSSANKIASDIKTADKIVERAQLRSAQRDKVRSKAHALISDRNAIRELASYKAKTDPMKAELASLKSQIDSYAEKIAAAEYKRDNYKGLSRLTKDRSLSDSYKQSMQEEINKISELQKQQQKVVATRTELNDKLRALVTKNNENREVQEKYKGKDSPTKQLANLLEKNREGMPKMPSVATQSSSKVAIGESANAGLEQAINLVNRWNNVAQQSSTMAVKVDAKAALDTLGTLTEGIIQMKTNAATPIVIPKPTIKGMMDKKGKQIPFKFNAQAVFKKDDIEKALSFKSVPKVPVGLQIDKEQLKSQLSNTGVEVPVKIVASKDMTSFVSQLSQLQKSKNKALTSVSVPLVGNFGNLTAQLEAYKAPPIKVSMVVAGGDLAEKISISLNRIQDLVKSKPINIGAKLQASKGEIGEQVKKLGEYSIKIKGNVTLSKADVKRAISGIGEQTIKINAKLNLVKKDFVNQIKAFNPPEVKLPISLKWGTGKNSKLAQIKSITGGLDAIEMKVALDTTEAMFKLRQLKGYAASINPLNITANVNGKGRATQQQTTSAGRNLATGMSRATNKAERTSSTSILRATRAAQNAPKTMDPYTRLRKWGYPFSGNTSFGARTPMALDMAKGMGMMYAVTGLMQTVSGAFGQVTEYDNMMKTVRAILETNDKNPNFNGRFNSMEQVIRKVGKETKFTAPEVAGAAKFMAMAGLNMEDINAATMPIANLALVGDNDLSETADKMTNIMTAFGLLKGVSAGQKQQNLTKASDVLVNTFTKSNTDLLQLANAMEYAGTMSYMSGTDLEDAAAMVGVMGNAGVQASMAGTTLRMMYRNIMAPTKKQKAEWDRLGVQRFDKNGNFRDIFDILTDLRKAITGSDDINAPLSKRARQKMAFSTLDMFRATASSGTAAVLMNLGEAINLAQSNRTVNGVAANIAEQKKNTISGLWAQVTSTFTDQSVNTVSQFQEKIKEMLRDLRDWLGSTEGAKTLGDIYDLAKSLIEVFANVAKVWKTILSVGGPVIKQFVKWQFLFTQFGYMLGAFTQMFGVISKITSPLLGLFGLSKIGSGVMSAVSGIGGSALRTAAVATAMTGGTVLANGVGNVGGSILANTTPAARSVLARTADGLVIANLASGTRAIPSSIRRDMITEAAMLRQTAWPGNMSPYAPYRDRLRSVSKMQRDFNAANYAGSLFGGATSMHDRALANGYYGAMPTKGQALGTAESMLAKARLEAKGLTGAELQVANGRIRSLEKMVQNTALASGFSSALGLSHKYYTSDLPGAAAARGQINAMAKELGGQANALRPSNHVPRSYMYGGAKTVMPFKQYANSANAVLHGASASTAFASIYRKRADQYQKLAYSIVPITREKVLENGTVIHEKVKDPLGNVLYKEKFSPEKREMMLSRAHTYRGAAMSAERQMALSAVTAQALINQRRRDAQIANIPLMLRAERMGVGVAQGTAAGMRMNDAILLANAPYFMQQKERRLANLRIASSMRTSAQLGNAALLQRAASMGKLSWNNVWKSGGTMISAGMAAGSLTNIFKNIPRLLQSSVLSLTKLFGMLVSPMGIALAAITALGVGVYAVVSKIRDHAKHIEEASKNAEETSKKYQSIQNTIISNGENIGGLKSVSFKRYEKEQDTVGENGYSLKDNKVANSILNHSDLFASQIINEGVGRYSKYLPGILRGMYANGYNDKIIEYTNGEGQTSSTLVKTEKQNTKATERAQAIAMISQWQQLALEQESVKKAAIDLQEAKFNSDNTKVNNILKAFAPKANALHIDYKNQDAENIRAITNIQKYHEWQYAQYKFLQDLAQEATPLDNYNKFLSLAKDVNKTISKPVLSGFEDKDALSLFRTAMLSVPLEDADGNKFTMLFNNMGGVDWLGLSDKLNNGIPMTIKQQSDLLSDVYNRLSEDPKIKQLNNVWSLLDTYLPIIANDQGKPDYTVYDFSEGWNQEETPSIFEPKVPDYSKGFANGLGMTTPSLPQWNKSFSWNGKGSLMQATADWNNTVGNANTVKINKPTSSTTKNDGPGTGNSTSNQSDYASKYGRQLARPTQIIFNIDQLCKFDNTQVASPEKRDVAESVGRQMSLALQELFSQAVAEFALTSNA